MVTSPTTTIVIVNYKVGEMVVKCLASLEQEVSEVAGTSVIVVENDSKDGSFEIIDQAIKDNQWQDWARVVASDKNGGYAYGNNVAINYTKTHNCETDFYWLLNPDTTVKPGSLRILLEFMSEHEKVGICGSSIEMEDGTPWLVCFNFPNILSELERGMRLGIVSKLLKRWKVPRKMTEKNEQVDWLPGASSLIRKQTFDDVGLLDDGYFLYYEETDFCYNALKKGWQCWYVPSSRIMHVGGASTGVSGSDSLKEGRHKRVPQYIFDSRRRYFTKNHGLLYTTIADFCWIFGYSVWSARRTLSRKPNSDPDKLLMDSIRNSVVYRFFVGLIPLR